MGKRIRNQEPQQERHKRKNTFAINSKKKACSPSARKSNWGFSEAKSRFDELFELARTQGPQTVTRKGREAVVIVAAEEYEQLTNRKSSLALVEFFAQSPLAKSGLDLERTPDYGRELKLFSVPNWRRRGRTE